MINTGDFGDAARTAGERVTPNRDNTGRDTGNTPRSDANRSGDVGAGTGTGTSSVGAGTTGTGTSGTATDSNQGTGAGTGAARPAGDRGDVSRHDNYAMVMIPESHGAKAVTLRLVNEGGQWKIDAPSRVDRQQLKSNLAKHIDMIDQDKANWPSDVNEAYRAISHHVFLAIDDTISSGRETTGTGTGAQPDANRNQNINPNAGK
jgi:hypothetical protein